MFHTYVGDDGDDDDDDGDDEDDAEFSRNCNSDINFFHGVG